MGFDLLNELQYQFGTKGALAGETQKDASTGKYEPTLLQRTLGITSGQLESAAETGEFRRFEDDSPVAQDAKRYGVTYTKADMDNLGGLQDRIDKEKFMRENRDILTSLGYTGDVSKYTSKGGLAGAIRTQREANERQTSQRQAIDAHYTPTAIDERMTRDRRYYDQQKANAQLRLDTLEATARGERREDMRYNERLEREAKKDRRAAMQNLVAGLASLGAAFAV